MENCSVWFFHNQPTTLTGSQLEETTGLRLLRLDLLDVELVAREKQKSASHRERDADGLRWWIGRRKTIPSNLPISANLPQNEQLLVTFGDFVARRVDRRHPG